MEEYKGLEVTAEECGITPSLSHCKFQMGYQKIEAIGNGAMAAIVGGFTPAYAYMAADGFSKGEIVKGITCAAVSVMFPIFAYIFGKRAWQHKKQLGKLKQVKQGLESKLN